MKPLYFFFVTLFFSYLLVKYYRPVRPVVSRWGEFLLQKAFPSYSGYEQYKFGLLRIFFGLIILVRAINLHELLIPEELFSPVGICSLLSVIAAFTLMAGLFAQWTLLFLMLVMWHLGVYSGDSVLGSHTLGNDVAAILSLLLLLTNGGRYLSLDAIILKRCPSVKKALLYFEDASIPGNIALSKFVALLAYWAVCLYSLAMHLNEPAWTTGVAGPLLLTSNFMSAWYQFFGHLFASSELAIRLARISIWLMMCWYITVLPLTLAGGFWRKYVIIWGVLFFTLSLVVLNLSALAPIEFVFWAAIFWARPGLDSRKKLLIFFDDKCNLCDRTIQAITFLDIFGRIQLMPVSLNNEGLQKFGISTDRALADLYGIIEDTREVKYGYDFYLLLSKSLVLLWPLAVVLYFGKALRVGPWAYRMIADNRTRIFGVCILPSKKVIREAPKEINKNSFLRPAILMHVIFLATCYLISLPAPYIGMTGSDNIASRAAHYYGITPINVFNKMDLKMAENWFTLRNANTNELVPVFTEAGTRLSMHKSDRVYFGNTVIFRRATIEKNDCGFETHKSSMEYLSKIYLHQKRFPAGVYKFHYTQYYQPLPDSEGIVNGQYIEQGTTIRCVVDFNVSYAA